MATKINAEQAARLKAFQKRVDAGETLAGEEARSFYNLQQVKAGKPTVSKADFAKQNPGTQTPADPNSDGKPSLVGQDPKNPPQTKTPPLLDKNGKISGVAQAGGVDVLPAKEADAVTIAPAAQMQAAQIAPVNTVDSLSQNTSLSGESRGLQMGLANQLQAQANGTAPSLAGLQLQQALDANQKSNLSLARSSDYINPAVAMRAALAQNATMGQQSAMTAAQARIAEVNAGQMALANVLNQQRGTDVGIEQNNLNAALTAQQNNQAAINNAALTQAGFQQQAGLTNSGASNAVSLAQGQLSSQNNQFNAGATNAQLQFASQLAAQNNQFNAGQVNQQTGQQAGLNTSAQNTGTQANASMSNAKTAAGAQVQSAGIYADASKYAADNSLQAATQDNLLQNDKQSPGAQTY